MFSSHFFIFGSIADGSESGLGDSESINSGNDIALLSPNAGTAEHSHTINDISTQTSKVRSLASHQEIHTAFYSQFWHI